MAVYLCGIIICAVRSQKGSTLLKIFRRREMVRFISNIGGNISLCACVSVYVSSCVFFIHF